MKFRRERHQKRNEIQYVNNSQITGTNTLKSYTEFICISKAKFGSQILNGYSIKMIQTHEKT